jgi:hypothetical protein
LNPVGVSTHGIGEPAFGVEATVALGVGEATSGAGVMVTGIGVAVTTSTTGVAVAREGVVVVVVPTSQEGGPATLIQAKIPVIRPAITVPRQPMSALLISRPALLPALLICTALPSGKFYHRCDLLAR